MRRLTVLMTFIAALALSSCSSTGQSNIPESKTLLSTTDNYSIVWVGGGQAYTYVNGQYERSESNDYSFEVVQRRYGNAWKSVKNMHRIHPDYDGKSGPREQTMFFGLNFQEVDGNIVSTLKSTLGSGAGTSDKEFREQTLQFAAEGISLYAPYNTFRITQHYKYEEGLLMETVELFKLKGSLEIPFIKIEETAQIFRPVTHESAPTRFN